MLTNPEQYLKMKDNIVKSRQSISLYVMRITFIFNHTKTLLN